jgi:hypothetical protein
MQANVLIAEGKLLQKRTSRNKNNIDYMSILLFEVDFQFLMIVVIFKFILCVSCFFIIFTVFESYEFLFNVKWWNILN